MSTTVGAAEGTVVIRRDAWGMPAIEATTEDDGWFGVGYAQAEDHFHELLAHYLLARGELSRLFGPSALLRDEQQRRWRVVEHAREDFAALPLALRRRQESFMAGVQHYAERHPERIPTWAPELEPALTMARLRTLAWPWAVADAMSALEAEDIGGLTIDAGASVGFERGSNAWALSGDRTVDGSAILLADPHLPLGGLLDDQGAPRREAMVTGAQFITFEFALTAGDLHFVGHAPIGLATPVLATTDHVAWALTTGQPNCSDAYRLATSVDGTRYTVDGDPRRIEADEVEIEVHGAEAVRAVVESVTINGRFAPIVAREGETAFAVSSPYVDSLWRAEVQLDAMLRSGDLDAFLETFDHEGIFPQNVVFADGQGRIGYVRAGRVPIRPPSVRVGTVLDGNTRATEWLGIHPAKDLLRVIDPANGFLQVCNTAPDTVTGEALDLLGEDAPEYLFNDEPGRLNSRGERILDLLAKSDGPVDIRTAIDAATDDVWVDTPIWLAALAAAGPVAADLDDDEVQRMHAALAEFDGRARAGSTLALWWQYWREELLRGEPEAAELCAKVERSELGPEVAAWVVRGLARGRDRLLADIGRLDARYGEVFRIGPTSSSAPGVGGAFVRRPPEAGARALSLMAPMRVVGYHQPADANGRRHAAFGGPALRLSQLTEGGVVTHCALIDGQSSRPGNTHWADQAPLVAERQLRTVSLSVDSWRAEATTSITLSTTNPPSESGA